MSITASCGHKLTKKEDMGVPASWKGYSHECTPAVVYGVLCLKCWARYKRQGILLKNETEEQEYLEMTK